MWWGGQSVNKCNWIIILFFKGAVLLRTTYKTLLISILEMWRCLTILFCFLYNIIILININDNVFLFYVEVRRNHERFIIGFVNKTSPRDESFMKFETLLT